MHITIIDKYFQIVQQIQFKRLMVWLHLYNLQIYCSIQCLLFQPFFFYITVEAMNQKKKRFKKKSCLI